MTENLKLEDLEGAEIVGYSCDSEKIRRLQIKLKDGTLVILKANGSVSDKRFTVAAWLEIWTSEICFRNEKKLL